MTERYGPGYGEEGAQRPSGRGAVTERLARQDQVDEIDLTDETTERESSGAFEPPPETARAGSANIFDVDERARQDEAGEDREEPVAENAQVAAPVAEPPAETPAAESPLEETPVEETPAAESPAEETPVKESPVADTLVVETLVVETPVAEVAATPDALLGSLDAGDIRSRFLDIQAGFIDEPRQAVEEAGRFVDDLLRQVADALQGQRGQLAGATEEASTEDLRLALRAYRQFVDRLLGLAS
jgi:hypothetical protein